MSRAEMVQGNIGGRVSGMNKRTVLQQLRRLGQPGSEDELLAKLRKRLERARPKSPSVSMSVSSDRSSSANRSPRAPMRPQTIGGPVAAMNKRTVIQQLKRLGHPAQEDERLDELRRRLLRARKMGSASPSASPSASASASPVQQKRIGSMGDKGPAQQIARQMGISTKGRSPQALLKLIKTGIAKRSGRSPIRPGFSNGNQYVRGMNRNQLESQLAFRGHPNLTHMTTDYLRDRLAKVVAGTWVARPQQPRGPPVRVEPYAQRKQQKPAQPKLAPRAQGQKLPQHLDSSPETDSMSGSSGMSPEQPPKFSSTAMNLHKAAQATIADLHQKIKQLHANAKIVPAQHKPQLIAAAQKLQNVHKQLKNTQQQAQNKRVPQQTLAAEINAAENSVASSRSLLSRFLGMFGSRPSPPAQDASTSSHPLQGRLPKFVNDESDDQ